jgi:chromosome partitioning protein
MRSRLQQTILARLMIDFGPRRIFRGIRTDVALAEAFGDGWPVRVHRPGARGAVDYRLLAQDVLKSWIASASPEDAVASPGS